MATTTKPRPAPAAPAHAKRMGRLTKALTEYQARYELSDAEMAAKIGVPRTTWTSIRNGGYVPRLDFAQQCLALVEFREIAHGVLIPDAA